VFNNCLVGRGKRSGATCWQLQDLNFGLTEHKALPGRGKGDMGGVSGNPGRVLGAAERVDEGRFCTHSKSPSSCLLLQCINISHFQYSAAPQQSR